MRRSTRHRLVCVPAPAFALSHVCCAAPVADPTTGQLQKSAELSQQVKPLVNPVALTTLPSGMLCVADPPTLQCFEPTGMMVGYVGQVGTLIGQYTGMAGITSDAEHIYVLDAHNHCVTMHRATDMMPLKKIGSRGSGNGQFHHHNWGSDLVLDGQGRLYVSDCNNDRVSVFSTELDFKYQLRGFSKPGSVAYGNSQLFVRCGGEIYVLNVNSRKVVRKMVVQGRLEGVAFFRDHASARHERIESGHHHTRWCCGGPCRPSRQGRKVPHAHVRGSDSDPALRSR